MRARPLTLLGFIGLLACTSSPNHIGNPLTLPGRAITNGISEAAYKARRKRVEHFVRDNLSAVHSDILRGDITSDGGPTLSQAMDIAGVTPDMRAALVTELGSNPALYSQPDIEPLIVAIMVHSN